ncbi:c-type cytochrome [Pseudorhodoferax sp.]|uniref:c-type cytochrome n=1 Tax=Pseudorhodoferax sp. TaxID=1993553 RepID=UPI002DD68F9B|nr:c-type cytochrome [Pseudorhodoferax sp.]
MRTSATVTGALLLALAGSAAAQTAARAAAPTADVSPERQTRSWAAACAACHGTEGRTQGSVPAIAGRSADQLYQALIEFKNNQRPAATVMHQHAKGYTDDELRRLAQFFATQRAQ